MTQEELQLLLKQVSPQKDNQRNPASDYIGPDDPYYFKDDSNMGTDMGPSAVAAEEVEAYASPDVGNVVSSADKATEPTTPITPFENYFPEEKVDAKKTSDIPDYLQKYTGPTIEPQLAGNKYKKLIDTIAGGGGSLAGGIAGSFLPVPGVGTRVGAGAGYVAGMQGAGVLEHLLNNWSRYKAGIPEKDYDYKKAAYNLPDQIKEAAMGGVADVGISKVALPVLKSAIVGLSGVPKTALDTVIKNPKRVEYLKNQPIFEEYKKFNDALSNSASEHIGNLELMNKELLKKSTKKIKVSDIISRLENFKKELLPESGIPSTATDVKTVKAINSQIKRLKNSYPKNEISSTEANAFLMKFGKEISWNPKTEAYRELGDPVSQAFSKEYGNLNNDIVESLPDWSSKQSYLGNTESQAKVLDFTKDQRWKNRSDLKNMGSTARQSIGDGVKGQYDREALKQLDERLGTNYLQQIQELGTADYFKHADMISGHSTGRSNLPYELGDKLANALVGPGKFNFLAGAVSAPAVVYKAAPYVSKAVSAPSRAVGLGGLMGYINSQEVPEKESEEEKKKRENK